MSGEARAPTFAQLYRHVREAMAKAPKDIDFPIHPNSILGEWLVENSPYAGPDLFDVAPPGVHALLAFRNVHRFTGVLDGTPLAVQE